MRGGIEILFQWKRRRGGLNRFFYEANISHFLSSTNNEILGEISTNSPFPDDTTQKSALLEQIRILKNVLKNVDGEIFFEYSSPRMGRRIDVV